MNRKTWLRTLILIIATVSCSSTSRSSAERLDGEYRATSKGALATVTFTDATHYWMVPSGPCPASDHGCVESGTYALNGSNNDVAFTDTKTGRTTSYAFKATTNTPSTLAAPLHPLGGASLFGSDGGGLVSATPVSLVTGFDLGGQSFRLGGCEACPTGFTCGSANGTSVCFSPTGVPRFTNIVVIMMENTTLTTLNDAGNTPYLTGLGKTWASSTDYHGVTHPSLRNYISLTSGDPQGIGSDNIRNKTFCDCHPTGSACSALNCVVAGVPLGNCGCPIDARNVADDIEAAGLTWHDYGEGMGSSCNLNDDSSSSYAARHIPFLYYDDIRTSSRCAANVVDYSSFAGDLGGSLPNFSFIAPNLVHDMHNPFPASSQNYANGDAWLSSEIPKILAAAPWQPGGAGLLIIVWDEDDLSGGLTQSTDNPIPMFVISPLAKSGGYVSASQYNHYNLLATVEDSFGLPRLKNAQGVQPMTDFFVNAGPPPAGDAGQ